MQQQISSRIVVMTSGGTIPRVMINALSKHFPDLHVVQEEPDSKATILRRRARLCGRLHAFGQLATQALVSKLGKALNAARSREIMSDYGVSDAPNSSIAVTHVRTLNDPQTHALVNDLKPAAIFTISCRILSRATLAAMPCPVINFHAGINPMYRGQAGGYWSRVRGDEKNFGATVHLVDAGIDTGQTLYEQRVKPSPKDYFSTYSLLMTAAGIDISVQALRDALADALKPYPPQGPSEMHFLPPIWIWLYHGLTKRIW